MPSSAVRSFTDPDEYAVAVRAGEVELTVTARGDFNAKLTCIDLHRLWMQRFSENLPRIAGAANLVGGRTYFSLGTRAGPTLLQDGLEMHPSTIIRWGPGAEFYQRSSGSAHLGTMSLPVEAIAPLGEAMAGVDLTPPRDALVVTPSPSAMVKLQRLHAAAGDLAENAPEIIANPDAARGLEHALIEALVGCLASGGGRENSLAQGHHAIVMRRFRRVVEENPEEPLYIPDICKAIRVSERTLRICCQEHLGMGPKRYLVVRRMHLARRTLRQSAPDATSVTDTATRFGFWQLGRFAVEYHALFGEAPSATLHRQPS
jgi:AraC-like DNA-binding protein